MLLSSRDCSADKKCLFKIERLDKITKNKAHLSNILFRSTF